MPEQSLMWKLVLAYDGKRVPWLAGTARDA